MTYLHVGAVLELLGLFDAHVHSHNLQSTEKTKTFAFGEPLK